MKRFHRATIGMTVAVALGITLATLADVVHLKNGRSVEGIIEKENKKEILLSFGVGSVRLKRSKIKSVERSGGEGNKSLEESWADKYFSHSNYVPEGLEDLANNFKRLERDRYNAKKALKKLSSVKKNQLPQREAVKAAEDDMVESARILDGTTPKMGPVIYNKVVANHNAVQAKVVLRRRELHDSNEQADQLAKGISEYMSYLTLYEIEFDKRKKGFDSSGGSQRHEVFFNKIELALDSFNREFKRFDVPFEDRKGQMVITVKINDSVDARLLLDTGASIVTVSEMVAKKLNLETPPDRTIQVSLADGSKVDATPVVLKSMQVGEYKVDDVVAVILPQSPTQGIDGLLGMSFLKEFSIHMDPSSQKLVLRQFSPGS